MAAALPRLLVCRVTTAPASRDRGGAVGRAVVDDHDQVHAGQLGGGGHGGTDPLGFVLARG